MLFRSKTLQYKDYSELRFNVPKHGLQTEIKNCIILDYAKEILNIAEKYLKLSQTGENMFLQSIKEYTLKGLSPADVILKSWDGYWNKNCRF